MIPLLKAKKDLNSFIENAEVRQKLINDKLAEVEMQKVNVDVHVIAFRLLISWRNLINISKLCKLISKKETGDKFLKMPTKNMIWNGQKTQKMSKKILNFRRYGNNLVETKYLPGDKYRLILGRISNNRL